MLNFFVLVSILLMTKVNNANAIGSCVFNGVSGTCESSCPNGDHTAYGTPGVNAGCKPYAKGIKCCTPKPQQAQPQNPNNGQGSTGGNTGGNQGGNNGPDCSGSFAWLWKECRTADNRPDNDPNQPQNPSNPSNPSNPVNPQPQIPVNPGQIACSVSGRNGFCSSSCTRTGYRHYSWGEPGVNDGCRRLATNIKCCAPAPAGGQTTVGLPTTRPTIGSGGMGPCTSPYHNMMGHNGNGQCRRTANCPSSLQSYPSRTGAQGCGHIPASDVQCCAPKAPAGLTVPSNVGAVSPQGECQLARPDSTCNKFTGRTMTVNVRFIDEIQRVHAHAVAAGVTIHITDSFRRSNAGYGASRSRHKVGFAIDMNASGCNAACMCRLPTRNRAVTTFLRRLVADRNLRWGGDPNRPINWSVGGCSRDSVHIQSTTYEAGSRYTAEQRCLNRAYNAGNFRRFSCTGAARLIDDVDVSNLESINSPPDEEGGLQTGGLVAIVLCAILCVALVVVIALYMVLRSGNKSEEQAVNVENAFYASPTQSGVFSPGYGEQQGYDSGYGTGYGTETTYFAAGTSNAPTAFACNQCEKAYSNIEDLQTHVSLRH